AAARGLALPEASAFEALSGRGLAATVEGRAVLVGNARLLAAVAGLAHARDPRTGLVRRVNYRDMDVEELGSVYEGLLELQPVLRTAGEYPTFDLGASGERKSTGSYYTNDGLVRELVASALDPVIADALARGRTAADKRANLLALKVCDPACGSGHFLLAAARGIGREVARLDAGDTEPDPREIRRGVREAIRHCVYGVDRNPLAVDLCKLALWLEGHDPGKPLGFLNARIKQGNSLVGTTFEMVGQPLPDDAFEPVIGDDKKIAASVRKRNRQERTGQLPFYPLTFASKDPAKYKHYRESLDHAPDTLEGVRASEHSYEDRQSWPDIRHRRLAFDLWTAAFFWPLVSGAAAAPTYAVVGKIAADRDALDCVADGDELAYDDPRAAAVSVLREARRLADDNGFFHWQLEFEDVFDRPDPGFDCILGNPPWERIKLQEQEFFAARDPEIANATNAAERKRKIEALREANPKLYAALVDAKRASEAESKFLRDAGRYPLTGRGDINTYSVFAEHMARTIRGRGRAGIIVPTGIATDDTNKHFFRWLVDGGRLASLYDFENREGLFSDVDSRTKFSLLTAAGAERPTAPFEAAFFLTQPDQLRDPARRFALDARDIALLNPNTRTCPIFRSQRDAVITLAVYRHVPSLSTQTDPHDWRASFFKKMIDFSVHADLIAFADDSPGSDWLPVYEAKMVHHFDHRFATYQGVSRRDRDVGNARAIEAAEKAIPTLAVKPRCWVTRETFLSRMRGKPWQQEWFVSVRDVARATDERTAIFAIRPGGPAVDKLPSLFVDGPACEIACLIGSLSSFAFDFVTRQKVGGANLGGYIIEQLPVLPRSTYTPVLLDQIVPRVLDLVYTANDLAPFARDCGYDGPPFTWDEERRAQLRADLDGLYAHLYGLSRDDFAYILDTFPIVRQKDEKRWGEYRTKRLCLEAYDRFAGDAAVASARAMAHVP
ncbi:MAG TPA: N-6 DNA methylase, partial [Thermomicrobiales bacterium]|nr:N-6 DNA methylase [Thermomicrobiales bacterium]